VTGVTAFSLEPDLAKTFNVTSNGHRNVTCIFLHLVTAPLGPYLSDKQNRIAELAELEAFVVLRTYILINMNLT
jgi:hypothetical protein